MKHTQYGELVRLRKECQCCKDLLNPAKVEAGIYDSDQIGPWSRWQGNLDAPLLLVGQDWGDESYFLRQKGWERAGNPTNRTLVGLLKSIGIEIGPPGADYGQNVVFFTNAILCLKQGGLQGQVRKEWFSNCHAYLRKQIEIVRPKVVVGLGKLAFDSVLNSFGIKPPVFRDAVEDQTGILLPNGSVALAAYHCGIRIQNTHRPLNQQLIDWQRVRDALGKSGIENGEAS